ncbi:cysteine-rich receptor-like protein kinase 8 [Tanacetum coccineum]|uniref:Cysteine-rich receptor-like protein kinase 8 n=1 Tax=Tanacetum coccineum TaxID=301880 RepID=A0ABQ4XPT7_9ASTR
MILILKTVHHGPSDAWKTLLATQRSLKRFSVYFSWSITPLLSVVHSEIVDMKSGDGYPSGPTFKQALRFPDGIACLSSHLDLLELLEDWMYDTGAFDHMTPVEDSVFDPYQLKIKPQIKLPNGNKSVVSHVGKVRLNGLDNKEGDRASVKDSYGPWHHKLGYVYDAKSKSCIDNCLSRPMEKFTKLPYSLSESHSTSVFELIHIDIWGSYKVPTNKKFRYFLTIVDDCTRGTWVYLLEQKSDSFEALKSFIKFVATQFEKKVKIVRSDNALEFVKDQCRPFLIIQSIFHQISYVDRPQQNGRVKRKHRHILDTARALSNPSRTADKFDPRVQKDHVNFKEAVAELGWCTTMDAELKALEDNDGTVDRKKARLVVQVAAVKGWFTCQMDVSNAFLHGDLLEEVYMKPPLGYTSKGKNVSADTNLDSHLSKINDSLFVKKKCVSFTIVLVYVDDPLITDWASCPMTRRSTRGYFILPDDSPVSWKSKKQVVVPRSSAEAEYMAMALTCYEVTWLVSLLMDLGIKDPEPVDLFCDNQAAWYIAANPIFHARTRHIEVDYHYVKDQLKACNNKPSYVYTKSHLAYVFIKVVTIDQHTKLLSKLQKTRDVQLSNSINSQLEGECTKDKGWIVMFRFLRD